MTTITSPARSAQPPVPVAGLSVCLSPEVDVCQDGRLLVSTRSGRAVRLRPNAMRVLTAGGGQGFPIVDATSWALAGALLDRDLAEPVWAPAEAPLTDLTVVIPVRDRLTALTRLLDALPSVAEVVVVDDASRDGEPLRAVAESRHARVIRRSVAGGPAAARNTGLRAVDTPFVAFLDSDVVPGPAALARLRRELDDPRVAIVGPRVLGLQDPGSGRPVGWIERYEQARSCLDLGAQPGRVAPGSRISYLPSAAMVARVEAIADGFDESMDVAEDVDLVWRVVGRGWGVRYCPRAEVCHEHRISLGPWLSRRVDYGTGAALLAQRHGAAVAPARLTPTATMLGVGLLVGGKLGRALAGCSVLADWVSLTVGDSWVSPAVATRLTLVSAVATAGQTGSLITRHHWPLVAVGMLGSRRLRRIALIAAITEGILDYRRVRPPLGLPAYLLAHRLDDAAYGWGVWVGAWRARSIAALRPAWLRSSWPGRGHRPGHGNRPPTLQRLPATERAACLPLNEKGSHPHALVV